MVVGGWWLVVGGWWLGLVVGGWWLVNMFGGWWLVVGGGGVGDVCSSGDRTRGHTLIFDKLMVRLLRTDCAVSRVWDRVTAR